LTLNLQKRQGSSSMIRKKELIWKKEKMSAQKELIVSRDIGQFPLVCAIKLRQTSVVPQVTLRRTALISSVIRILVWDTVKYTI